jgi:dipeptidyl aminopeptidase/acylaminoacyl peptidase
MVARAHRRLALALSVSLIVILLPGRAGATCGDLLPQIAREDAVRGLAPEDLVRLRDIGPADNGGIVGQKLFALSPDGQSIAFQLRRGDPASNSYCLGMVVKRLATGAAPVLVDQGGDLIRSRFDIKERAATDSGIPLVITPQWSPDGRWIAFLKKAGNFVQVWRAEARGGSSGPLTHVEADIGRFQISADGHTLIFAFRPGIAAAKAAINREGLSGYHYDERFAPISSNRPFPRTADAPESAFALDLITQTTRDATASEKAQLDAVSTGDGPDGSRLVDPVSGWRAWIATDVGASFPPQDRVFSEASDGRDRRCSQSHCAGSIVSLWFAREGRRVRYLSFEGWAQDRMAIYEWRPGGGAPRRLYETPDLLLYCEPSGDSVLCAREQADRPRHLVRIDLRTRRISMVFDPNPDFSALRLGRIEPLEWTNGYGLKSFGDLVYPVAYRADRRYPLIVVQYGSRGFLRGGTGAEYPIQAFANRGFAVLSVNRPAEIGRAGARSWDDVNRLDLLNFADRRSVLSTVETEVRDLVRRGIADPARLGITGLSDGSSTVQFAALNSSLFAAGAASGCCWERTQGALLGPTFDRVFREVGWPGVDEAAPEFWSQISLAQNGGRVRFPLLMQEGDDEYLTALESYSGLKQAGAPVDLYVYPGEYHFKWQPAHLLSVYQRSIAWFEYWLNGASACSSCTLEEKRGWDGLRHGGHAAG